MTINKQTAPVQSVSASKFFAQPSKLSTGEKNRRFKSSLKSETIMTRASNSSDGVAV